MTGSVTSDSIQSRHRYVQRRYQTVAYARGAGLALLLHQLPDLDRIWIKFRTQKNGKHGEEKMFTRNPTPGGFCCLASVYRAMTRFQTLQALDPHLDPAHTPLSVYLDPSSNRVKLVTSKEIERLMRRLAASVYNLCPALELSLIHI